MTFVRKALVAAALASAPLFAGHASAQTVLTFEGVGNGNAVGSFYDGGAGGNLGIQFVNAYGLVDSDAGGTDNFANEPSASTVIYFTSGSASTMNVAAGFTTGFSFYYTAASAGSVNVYSGLNGTGSLLATLALPAQYNGNNCAGDSNGTYCNFSAVGVTFAGTAQSATFGGAANGVALDNITLGSATAGGAVPEPAAWAMMILGMGAIGYAMRRQKISTRVSYAAA